MKLLILIIFITKVNLIITNDEVSSNFDKFRTKYLHDQSDYFKIHNYLMKNYQVVRDENLKKQNSKTDIELEVKQIDKAANEWKKYAEKIEAIQSSLESHLNEYINNKISNGDDTNENSDDINQNTKVFILLGETTDDCQVILKDGILYGNFKSCYERNAVEKVIKYENTQYSCSPLTSSSLGHVFSNCKKIPTPQNSFENFKVFIAIHPSSDNPCMNYSKNENGNFYGLNCHLKEAQLPITLNIDDEQYSCHGMTRDDIYNIFELCKINVADGGDDDDTRNLKVFVNTRYFRNVSSSCSTFARGNDKNLYASDCYESYAELFKLVSYNGSQFKCWHKYFEENYIVYDDCYKIYNVKLAIDDDDHELLSFTGVNRRSKFLVRKDESHNNTDLPCTNNIIDGMVGNHEIYCTEYAEKFPSVPKIFNFMSQLYTCNSYITYAQYTHYYNCRKMIKSNSLNEDQLIDDGSLKVYTRIIPSVYNLRTPCREFILAEDNNLYGSDCYEDSIAMPKIVSYKSIQFECKTSTKGDEYKTYSDCYRV